MSECLPRVTATLLLSRRQAPDPADLVDEVVRRMRQTGLALTLTEPARDGSVRLRNDDMVLGIDRLETVPPALLSPPTTNGSAVLAPLADDSGCAVLRVTVEASHAHLGATAPSPGHLAACVHATGILAQALGARTILWQPTDTLFSPEAFAAARLRVPGILGRETGPAAIAPPPATCSTETDAQRPDPAAAAPCPGPAGPVLPRRPVRPPVFFPRRSRPSLALLDPPHPDRLHPPADPAAPPPERTERSVAIAFRAAPLAPPVRLPVQLAVYTLSLTMMIFAFPVGFAMMIYNILGGERLRLTTLAMALTCAAWGLNRVGLTESLLALF